MAENRFYFDPKTINKMPTICMIRKYTVWNWNKHTFDGSIVTVLIYLHGVVVYIWDWFQWEGVFAITSVMCLDIMNSQYYLMIWFELVITLDTNIFFNTCYFYSYLFFWSQFNKFYQCRLWIVCVESYIP